MAWNVEYVWPHADVRQIEFVAFRGLLRDAWTVGARRPEYRYVILRQQIGVVSDVIGVMMGIMYWAELQTLGAQGNRKPGRHRPDPRLRHRCRAEGTR